ASSCRRPPLPTLFPYTTLFRSASAPGSSRRLPRDPVRSALGRGAVVGKRRLELLRLAARDPKSRSSASSDTSPLGTSPTAIPRRSEEHTSELQSRENLVCRLLL